VRLSSHPHSSPRNEEKNQDYQKGELVGDAYMYAMIMLLGNEYFSTNFHRILKV
jgi:hypothetical protein